MIPKIIHQTWRSDKLPSIFQKIYDRNKTLNPEFEFKLWSHSPGPPDIDNFIEKEYPDIYEIYKKTKYGVQKADIARLAILHHYGGIYFDLDIMCLKDISELIEMNSDIAYFSMEPTEQTMSVFKKDNVLCNAFMAVPAKHIIMDQAIKEIKAAYEKNGDNIFNIFNCFGSDIVARSCTATKEHIDSCKFVKRDLVYPICDPKLSSLPTCERDISMLKKGDYNNAYMVHYWIHSDFESKEKIDKFTYDESCSIHENIYKFFKELYPDHKYLLKL